jgi:hypothetical protein
MPVKIFTAAGHDKIKALELEINRWVLSLEAAPTRHSVRQVSTALSPIRDGGKDQEMHQYLVVTILYE